MSSAEDIINGYNAPTSSCAGDGVCISGDTPSFAALGEIETPVNSDNDATIADSRPESADIDNRYAHGGVDHEVNDYVQEAADRGDAETLAAEVSALAVSGVKVFAPGAVSAELVETAEHSADAVGAASVISKIENGDRTGAATEAGTLIVGHVGDYAMESAGVEPHLFVRQTLLVSEKLAEKNMTNAVENMRSEMGMPSFYPSSGNEP